MSIILHCGARPVSRTELATVACPEGTDTWKPIAHLRVLDTIQGMLESSGFLVQNEQLGLTGDSHRFFGTLDLGNVLAPGVSLSVGVRNSTDQSLPLGFCAGNRVFVCDNLSFSSDLIVNRKHTKNGAARFSEAIALAVQGLAQFQLAETRRIQILRDARLSRFEAEAYLLSAFEKGILSARTLPVALKQYRAPQFDWGSRDHAWHLFNAVTTALQPRARSNPRAFAWSTMQLVSLFFPTGNLGFDSSDLGFIPDDDDVHLETLPDFDEAEARGKIGYDDNHDNHVPVWL